MADDKKALLAQFGDDYSPLVELIRRLGPEQGEVVLEVLGGTKPHIPTAVNFWGSLSREVRDEMIRVRFRGNNLAELISEFGLSERQLRYILHGATHHKKPQKSYDKTLKISMCNHETLTLLANDFDCSLKQISDAMVTVVAGRMDVLREIRQHIDGIPAMVAVKNAA